MLPDFSKPGFSFVALCSIRFNSAAEGGHAGPFRSDYRCQFRYMDDQQLYEVRVYFVGQQTANEGEEFPVILAFLDWEQQRDRCRVGTRFDLREGGMVTAKGLVQTGGTKWWKEPRLNFHTKWSD